MKAVDLGLSVMWGDCNLGANECYENGKLYAWNEIMPETDNNTSLGAPVAIPSTMTSDLAEKMWGFGWKVPTRNQMLELMQHCEFEFIPVGRTKLLKATGPNGNSIYLPLAGNLDWNGNNAQGGFYWTSTKAIEESGHAYQMCIAEQITFGYNYLNVCQSIRPVYISVHKFKVNYNRVDNPINYNQAGFDYIKFQIVNWCTKLNIPYKISEFKKASSAISKRIPMADYMRVIQLEQGNALGHGNVTFLYSWNQQLVALLISNASEEYISSVKDCGLVYGVILGLGSITYGSDLRTDTIVKLKPDEIYVRLY